jgi:hypothetical protein
MKSFKYRFLAEIIEEDTGERIALVEGFSQESLEEEMGKTKWTGAIKEHEDKLKEDEQI